MIKRNILVTLLFWLFLFGFLTSVSGKTIYVDDDGGADYKTIQNAIKNAYSGDIIFIYNGTYYNDKDSFLYCNKSLTFIGENKNTTIIEGDPIAGLLIAIISLDANNIKISNLTFQHGHSIQIYGNNIEISNIILNDTVLGINLRDSNNSYIKNNVVKNSSLSGITFTEVTNSTIIQNTVESCDWGITLDFYSNNNTISENLIYNNSEYGINIKYISNDNQVINNTIKNNPTGISITELSINNIISNNTFLDNNKDIYDESTASKSPTSKTPGFELIFVLIAVALVLFWQRKRI